MHNNKSLGRGLSAFLDLNVEKETAKGEGAVLHIAVDSVVPNPFQPRQNFDEETLRSLAESIKQKGVLQPVLMIDLKNGKYQLVAGERRFRATKMAGLSEIPAIVTELGEKDQLEIAILENIQREDLNPIEEAEAYKRLMVEFSYTQEELSGILGQSRSHIANILRLLTLPDDVKEMIRRKQITFGHARALIGTEDPSKIANRVITQSMNVRETENLIKAMKEGTDFSADKEVESRNVGSVGGRYTDPELLNVAGHISAMVGLQVNIKLKKKGGVIELNFKDFGELDRLLGRLNERLG